ncbi:hypothetical protein [Nostoc sp.]
MNLSFIFKISFLAVDELAIASSSYIYVTNFEGSNPSCLIGM